ncbi:hypothetical protein ES703_108603 [subsurface metagenome]
MRQYVMPEVRGVVPYIKPVANLRPADDVVTEFFVSLVGQRLTKRALDTAQPDDNIVPRLNIFGRLPCVLISQGADSHLWKFLFDISRHCVHKMQQRPGRTAFSFIDSRAFAALTVTVPVVLRNRSNRGGGVSTQLRL